ncbi:hypothetical protein [Sphingomonas sp. LHG3406-1]|uniref:hypothetical protein n=1 Tax=Sphingomonas sp. LHG3406-1 TaxID=2804617 RepID=UPI002622FCBD|nr:hypothetical protein [Sphingomonas sp. LHG3406-1]
MILACGALLVLASCDAEMTTPAEGDEKVKMAADADGRVSFDMPFAKGEIKLPAKMLAETDFNIDGVKMVPGGTITGFNLDADKNQPARVNLTFAAPTSPEAVKAYFVEQFRAKEMELKETAEGLSGVSKEGDKFLMTFVPQGSGTSGSIRIDSQS